MSMREDLPWTKPPEACPVPGCLAHNNHRAQHIHPACCGYLIDGGHYPNAANHAEAGPETKAAQTAVKRVLEHATKFDSGKPRMSLLSQRFLREMGHVARHGEAKYQANNWRNGLSVSRCLDAAIRHLGAAAEGADIDPETGDDRLNQLAQAAINCMFAWEMIADHPELDDRWKP
jgi:dATP/dGTP diphosphohydrolase